MLVDLYKHKGMRKILCQTLRRKGFRDPSILAAIEKVPRHYFLDKVFEKQAYEDKPFPIGEGQTISQPYTVAIQTLLLDIQLNDKVLEVGTGSGYQSCILNELGANVYSIEYNKVLFEKTKKKLQEMGYPRIKCFCGDGSLGLPHYAPFDKILVTAGAPGIPEALFSQLKPGGILVIPVGNEEIQSMMKISKTIDGLRKNEEFGDFKFVPLKGKKGWK